MKVHAVRTGSVWVRERQREGVGKGKLRFMRMLLDRHWTEPLPIYCWIVEHEEGLTLVDTGDNAATSQPGYFPRWHPYYKFGTKFEITQQQEIGPQLKQMGIDLQDVRRVVLTHLHTDHSGGLHYFPHADFLVTRR